MEKIETVPDEAVDEILVNGLEGAELWLPAVLFAPIVLLSVLALVLLAVVFVRSKGQYQEYIQDLDKKEWSLKEYLPMGFLWCSWDVGGRLAGPLKAARAQHRHNVYTRILLLYGKLRGAEQMYFVYEANKATLSFLLLALVALFAPLGVVANGDLGMGYAIWGLGLAVVFGLPLLMDKELDKKIKDRGKQLQLEFPTFGSKLILLINAGMTVPAATRKIVTETHHSSPLMTELREMLRGVEGGMSEIAAYEEFARRCNVKEISRFISVLVQSMEKGGAGIAHTLNAQIQDCWQARKTLARVMGQEASTRLVLPLMLMMVGIIFMVGGPALLMFGQM